MTTQSMATLRVNAHPKKRLQWSVEAPPEGTCRQTGNSVCVMCSHHDEVDEELVRCVRVSGSDALTSSLADINFSTP